MNQDAQTFDRQADHNDGIDALRIVSMIMVVILHVLLNGGILDAAPIFSAQYEAAWLLETAAYCAVDCYALISGYVGYGRKFRYASILYLTLQVLFYTIPITGLMALVTPSAVGLREIIKALFPSIYNVYWYFSAYFFMFFFIPFLNACLEQASRDTLRKLIITVVGIAAVVPTLFYYDMGNLGYGYSALWLSFLYLTGGYMKKYDLPALLEARNYLFGYILFVSVSWLSKVGIDILTSPIFGTPKGSMYLIRYNSPLIFLCAVCLVSFFCRLRVNAFWSALIKFFAPLSFSVYLIHTEPLVWDFWTGAFAGYVSLHPFLMAPAVIGTALAIWLPCSLIDKVRLTIFNFFHIREKCADMEEKVTAFLRSEFHHAGSEIKGGRTGG